MIELLDGTQIVGTSDADVIARWKGLHWAAPEMTTDVFKQRILDWARTMYGCRLIGLNGTSLAEWFLDGLAAEGALTVIRK
jgi:hypothetical protein